MRLKKRYFLFLFIPIVYFVNLDADKLGEIKSSAETFQAEVLKIERPDAQMKMIHELTKERMNRKARFHKKTELFFEQFQQDFHYQDVHIFPAEHRKAARLLGDLAQDLYEKKIDDKDALEFYSKCANEEVIPSSMRSVCLQRAIKLVTTLKIDMPSAILSVPLKIFHLAQKLPIF